MANYTKSGLISPLLILVIVGVFSVAVMADGGMPIQDTVVYSVPDNLDSLSTEEITSMRAERQRDLEKTAANANEEQKAEQLLFEKLMAHDLVRLSISDVIDEMIADYQIDGEFKEILLGYQETFAVDMMENRKVVHNLQDYPSYDFRFAAVYMSMLYAFQKYPDFYERLKVDMINEDTPIGSYKKTLDDSYAGVKQARAEMDLAKSGADIKKVIAALDSELARRSN
ncbi:MAG: hypothetical protein R8G33_08035 [Gammaproteobacteria bacterium]|nr:hypothetical protein [Gammaproteobacteria bacterium]